MAFSCNKVVIFVMCTVSLVGTCMIETAQARKVAISRHYGVSTTEPRLLSEKETESNSLRKNGDDDHNTNKDENNKPSTSWGEQADDNKIQIGNGAMTRDLPACGPNNKNCVHQASNPYNRGCNQGDRCRGHPRKNAGLKSVGSNNGDHDDDDDEPDEENKTTISNGAMSRNQRYCGPNNKNCKNKEQGNPYNRGCNSGNRCRGRPNDDEKTESKTGGDDDEEEKRSTKSGPEEENKTNIGNGAMSRDQPYCGPNNKNCQNKEPGNTYNRGCNQGNRCRGRPNEEEKTESKTGDHDNEEEEDEKRSTKSGPEDENKITIGNGVMQRNSPYCGPLSNGRCHQMEPANQYNRGCNAGEKCRDH